MNKKELCLALASEAGLSKAEAKTTVEMFFDELSEALAKGQRVEIRGLCSIGVKKYKPYTGRNPKTGEDVSIPEKKLPFFKCGKELRDRLNREGTD